MSKKGGEEVGIEGVHRVEEAKLERYVKVLVEKSRPPSRGGNTRAMHRHILVINGVGYSFLAAGSRQFAFKSDTVSFSWRWDDTRKYRNIDVETLVVKDKVGQIIVRQVVGAKAQWRTADARMPVSRREFRD